MKLLKEKILLPAVFTVPEVSIKKRDALVTKSRKWGAVNGTDGQEIIAGHARQLRTLVKDAKAVCAPILKAIKTAGDAVRKIQNDYIAPVELEQERCERMLVEFHKAEEERAKAEEAARQAEIERLNAESEAALKAAQSQPGIADIEALRAEMEAHDTAMAAQALILAPPPEPVKPKGVAMVQRKRFEVTDIHALYQFNPAAVRMEPNASWIQEHCYPEMPTPGVRVWIETTAETRAA